VCLALKHFTHNNFDFTGLARSLNEVLQRRLRIAARPVRWRNPFELRFNRDASGTFTSRIRDREALRKHEPKLRSELDIIKSGRLHLANIRVRTSFTEGFPLLLSPCPKFKVSDEKILWIRGAIKYERNRRNFSSETGEETNRNLTFIFRVSLSSAPYCMVSSSTLDRTFREIYWISLGVAWPFLQSETLFWEDPWKIFNPSTVGVCLIGMTANGKIMFPYAICHKPYSYPLLVIYF